MPAATYSITVYKRNRSPFWWARWYIPGAGGVDKRWSTGVRIEGRESKRVAARAAEAQAAEFDKERRREQPEGEARASMSAVVKRMLEQKIADGLRDRAIDTLGWQLDKHVLPYFKADRDVRSIRRADLEGFKSHLRGKGYAAQTINNLLTAIRQVLKHAWKVDELLEAVPEVENVPTDKDPKWRILTPAELDALIKSIDPRAREARHFLLFVANTGLRKSEALAMRYSWIDWEARLLRIPASFTKGGRGRPPVQLNAVCMAVLEERRANPPKRAKDRDRVFLQLKHDEARNSAAKRAKLGRVRTHDLRHTRGSLAHAAGASLVEVRDMLGHKTLAMVNHYAHTYDDRMREIAEKLVLGSAPSVPSSVPDESAGSGKEGSVSGKPKSDARRKGR